MTGNLPALTHRQWQVLEGIKAQKRLWLIADELGLTPQRVTQIRADLRDLGVIRLRGDLPAHGRYEEVYPWELVSDQPLPYRPALPPTAVLRLEYPRDIARDVTVPPIRHVWWPDPDPRWSIQGIAMARPDGKRPKEALPETRVVVVSSLVTGMNWARVVPSRVVWHESHTDRWLGEVVTDEDLGPMTLLIAAAIGVESVADLKGD